MADDEKGVNGGAKCRTGSSGGPGVFMGLLRGWLLLQLLTGLSRADDSGTGQVTPWQTAPNQGWGLLSALKERGFSPRVVYISEGWWNTTGGRESGGEVDALLRAEMRVETEPTLGWAGGMFHACLLVPHGRSLSARRVGDLMIVSGIDAPDGWRLHEIWYEQKLAQERLALRVGQLAADEEFPASVHSLPFIHSSFGWPALMALNMPTPAYPFAVPGVRLGWQISDKFHWRQGLYAGDPLAYHADGRLRNRRGVEWSFNHGAFYLSEWQWHNETGAEGVKPWRVALGTFWHTGRFSHARLDDTGLSLADPGSSGVPMEKDMNYGFYLAAGRMFWQEAADAAQGLELFMRVAGSPADRNPMEFYLEGGLVYTGLLPGRAKDKLGLGVVYGQMSREVRRLAREEREAGVEVAALPDFEAAVEVTYHAVLTRVWILQPVVQWIIHPGGSRELNDAVVVGVRSVLDF
ncbi:MAG: carbohydrate porin [Verrucomicrobiae bacterium]|nr:carbohydrate porin [Verrucomicrobiae bacterium]